MRSPFPHVILFVVAVLAAVGAGLTAGPAERRQTTLQERAALEDAARPATVPVRRERSSRPAAGDPAHVASRFSPPPTETPAVDRIPGTAAEPLPPRSPAPRLRPRDVWMEMPVAGVHPQDLQDTFADAQGVRTHGALDIHAPRGTPVLAAAGGTVQRIWDSEPGGHTVYVLASGGRLRYYYAHLQGYREGLAEGERLQAGDLIGYVGDSGDAVPGDTHLHFAVFEVDDVEDWAGGKPIDPLPYLRGEKRLPS
ncbi:MAG: M23 family metallopeptidase [Gemmatimonadota bacterium]